MGTSHFSGLNIKFTALSEGSAGNHTVTGITTDDVLIAVIGHKITLSEGTPNTQAVAGVNLTSEFTITAADTINNSAGTALTDTAAIVIWLDKDLA
jgi:hypothetical protein